MNRPLCAMTALALLATIALAGCGASGSGNMGGLASLSPMSEASAAARSSTAASSPRPRLEARDARTLRVAARTASSYKAAVARAGLHYDLAQQACEAYSGEGRSRCRAEAVARFNVARAAAHLDRAHGLALPASP